MPNTARKSHLQDPVVSAEICIDGGRGGPVSELQRTLHERLSPASSAVPIEPVPFPIDERVFQAVSRAAGPILLAASFASIVALLAGRLHFT